MMDTQTTERKAASLKKPMQTKTLGRRLLLWTHMTLGLSICLFLVMMGLSGASMIFRPELERAVYPGLTHSGPAGAGSADACLEAAKLADPEAKILYLTPPVDVAASMSFTEEVKEGSGKRRQFLYAAGNGQGSCQVLGIRKAAADPLSWIMGLHHTLLLGAPGQTVIGYLGCLVITLALTGLALWWPKRWTPSRFKVRASARPLHYGLGFWVLIPLLVIGLTGTYLAWKEAVTRILVAAPITPAMRESRSSGATEPPGDATPVSLDAVLAAVHDAAPDAVPSLVRIAKLEYPITVEFEEAGERYRQSTGKAVVVADAHGIVHVAKLTRERDGTRMQRFLAKAQRVHQAEWGGLLVKVIWCCLGIAPAVLFGSGFLMWRRRVL
ncbi:MAG: PepSY domain-containing protein [Acidobacteriota bacterium]|nr:PepSY domain-containing protein [Acidobacteriota bacterium]